MAAALLTMPESAHRRSDSIAVLSPNMNLLLLHNTDLRSLSRYARPRFVICSAISWLRGRCGTKRTEMEAS